MDERKYVRVDESMVEGAVSCEMGEGWIRPWRLPFARLDLFPDVEGLQLRAKFAAGVRLRFATDADAFALEVLAQEAARKFDLTLDGDILHSVTLDAQGTAVEFVGLPAGENTYELWLPTNASVELSCLALPAGASFRVPADPRPKWVTYGSSITHCGGAASPARSWPATAARARNLNLTCLGYGGQCHLEPMVARMIRDLPADLISLKLGINVQGGSTLSGRTFKPAVIGLVQIIRERHPAIPVVLVSPIISPPRESAKNAVGLSLEIMRDEVEDAWRRLVAAGDSALYYVHGHRLFGEELVADYLPDQLHPNGPGYEIMGRNAVEHILDPVLAR